jgi:hypothetical protein
MTTRTARACGWALVLAAVGASSCDDDAAKRAGGTAGASTTSSATAASSAAASTREPEPPRDRAPIITVDDHGASVDGTTFTTAPSQWRAEVAAMLSTRPKIAGEAVVVTVTRDAKTPKVEAMVAALGEAKAKSVVVHTQTRDQTTGELTLTRPKQAPECSAVAMIERDGAVAVWSKGGGVAQRYTRGMAGPDLSSSTEALRKRAGGCDSPVWFVAGADTVTWGLVFDLAMRARNGGEGGGLLKPTETVLLTEAPVAGRPVKP